MNLIENLVAQGFDYFHAQIAAQFVIVLVPLFLINMMMMFIFGIFRR